MEDAAAVKMELATESRTRPTAPPPERPRVLGIWRLGQVWHRSETAELALAQPADAAGSPRWDYVLKRATGAAADLEGRQQISRFIAAATAVSHPNLVAVLDGSDTGVAPYLVMPRLEGSTMAAMLGGGERQPLPVALWLVRQTAQALAALHHAGWVHGDVKPDNVVVGSNGHVTVIDLGFAARVHTPFGPIFRGTPDYASPELVEGRMAALPAMDVFALGRVLWQWMIHLGASDEGSLRPVAELVEAMLAEQPEERPTAERIATQLLQLEIESLGGHIGPSGSRRRAA